MQRQSHNRIRRTLPWIALAALVASAAACTDQPPTAPRAAPRPAPQTAVADDNAVLPQDLGTLPGDRESEATYVTEDGVVYGESYGAAAVRFFRWTQAGGMTQVSAVPQPPKPPIPTLLTPPGAAGVFPVAANVKGEATGQLCYAGQGNNCTPPGTLESPDLTHAFRSSPGGLVWDIDPRFFLGTSPPEPAGTSHGLSINRWGHVAGALWFDPGADDPKMFVWTPVDSFRVLAWVTHVDLGINVNDVDQVVTSERPGVDDLCSWVWRPDLGLRLLATDPQSQSLYGPCVDLSDLESGAAARVRAQQRLGTWAVGSMVARADIDGMPFPVRHAALWRVPAVSRAAFPSVNANPYGGTGSVRLSTGGVYYQLYKATQATDAGPYTELVDWGDGTSSRRTRAGIGVLTSQHHAYAKAGTFWVRVYVKDAQGRWAVGERGLTVSP